MLRKIPIWGMAIAISLSANAQENPEAEKKSAWKFSGSVDGYFRTDLRQNLANNRTSFTNSTGKIQMGMVSAKADFTSGKFNIVADLAVGKRVREFAYNDKGVLSSVKQLYGSYQAADWIKFTAGTWATHVGYELLDPNLNRNYSMSYMFSYGPFLHTGLKSEITLGKSGFLLGVASPTDYRKAPEPNKKSLLVQFSQALTENIKIFLNYVGGQRPADLAKTRQVDLVLTAKTSDQFNIGFNGTLSNIKLMAGSSYDQAKSWWGAATYMNYDPNEKIGFTLRSELFNDHNQLSALGAANYGASIVANTLSANFKVGPVTMIPELRIETANSKIYSTKLGTEKSGSTSLLIGAYYAF